MSKILKHFIPKAFSRMPDFIPDPNIDVQRNRTNFLSFCGRNVVYLKPMNNALYVLFYQTLRTFERGNNAEKDTLEKTILVLDKDLPGALALYSRLHFNVYESIPEMRNKEGLGHEGANFLTFSGLGYTKIRNQMLQKSIYSVDCQNSFEICDSEKIIGNMALNDKHDLDKVYARYGKQSFIDGLFSDKHIAHLMSIDPNKNILGYYDWISKYACLAKNYLNHDDMRNKLVTSVLFKDALSKLDTVQIGESRYTSIACDIFELSAQFGWHLVDKDTNRILVLKDLAPDDVESILKSSTIVSSDSNSLELPTL